MGGGTPAAVPSHISDPNLLAIISAQRLLPLIPAQILHNTLKNTSLSSLQICTSTPHATDILAIPVAAQIFQHLKAAMFYLIPDPYL